MLITLSLLGLFLTFQAFPVHALGESYKLTLSTSRIQETNGPGVTFVLNVTKATTGLDYKFTWVVIDPGGTAYSINTQVNSVPATFTTSVNYPTGFGTSITTVGTYNFTVTQTSPPPTTKAGTSLFRVGLTDAETYRRTDPVSLIAQGYGISQNVNVSIVSKLGPAPGFPTTQQASPAGVLVFTWTSVPASAPLGNYTVTLTSNPAKTMLDTQSFLVGPANVTISQLYITQSSLQRSETEAFRFSASYPNTVQAKNGSATIRVTEADGVTVHNITAVYRSKLGQFEGTYQIPLSSDAGAWVASIDIGSFNDGYGNTGPPSSSVNRGFAVSPAILTVTPSTPKNNYTIGNIVAIYASVVTLGGANFTSGTVTAATFFSTRQIGSSILLSYDQSRGKWVGSYLVNSTDPSGVWLIQVNATDAYGNSGIGSTSTLVTVPPSGPSTSSPNPFISYWFLGLVATLIAGLVVTIVLVRRKTFVRKVLKIDLEAVSKEAHVVENQDFFKNIKEQLRKDREGPAKPAEKTD